MRALIQRATEAKVTIAGETVGSTSKGVVILLGITPGDTQKEVDFLAEKILNLRIFPKADGTGEFDTSLLENSYEILAVSQFTLYGACDKGRRPDFMAAAKPDIAEPLYNSFVEKLRASGLKVETGRFGADMQVALTNWGPCTLMLEKNNS
jgi:D-tyrosyl-tRNA(Tyr) deacylase